jgi:hypothetical protein
MPSDLPLMSTGRATYPVPPQRGQSFGSTDPPQLPLSFSLIRFRRATKSFLLRNTNTRAATRPTGIVGMSDQGQLNSASRYGKTSHQKTRRAASLRQRSPQTCKPKSCVKLVQTRTPERWQSGRMRRFAKPLYGLTPVPRVRIPASPPASLHCREVPALFPAESAKHARISRFFFSKPDCRERTAYQ